MLRRDSGPSGWLDQNATGYERDGWESFEGDPASPHMCRGWLRCTADHFTAGTGTRLTSGNCMVAMITENAPTLRAVNPSAGSRKRIISNRNCRASLSEFGAQRAELWALLN